jgi:RIO kinase 1
MTTRSNRKKPSREKHPYKEIKKTESMLDKQTMIYLSKFFNKEIISKLDFIIASGKESDIYIAESGSSDIVNGEPHVVLKFFRIESSSFFNMSDYINGDPRFVKNVGKSKASIVATWCKKEFGNLKIAADAGVNAPKPYMYNGNILAMQFIGTDGIRAPQLKDVALSENETETILESIIKDIGRLYRANLVHGDLSEYNILVKEKVPYFIDFGQAVMTKHPNAAVFLRRDVANMLNYFRKRYSIKRDFDEVYKSIIAAD